MRARAQRSALRVAAMIGAAVVCLGTQVPASAQDTSSAPSATYSQALTAFDQAWDAAPLGFAVRTFVDVPAKGFGIYTPRTNQTFAAGETLHVYAEPIAYGFETDSEGTRYSLNAGFKLLNPSGQVLAEEAQFAAFTGTTRSRKRELSTQLSFGFEGLPAGSYTLAIDLSDVVSGQTATFSLPFSVVAGE
ncbi:hypothetical protein J0X15_11500 [Roseibium sp. CAU 1637]|uniref:Uncharacterized protein n=1 Tax=Roseibium limicola TaxID=2816037 RepID=A0A939J900_9HYPH|nr:hypothetical protein [Roseibium limicola]